MDAAKEELANALVAVVGGTRPWTSADQVLQFLESFHQVPRHQVRVCRSYPNDFLLVFKDERMADQVLHATPSWDTSPLLIF
jgi:hypothetical protein